MKLGELKPNPENPRKISPKKLEMLQKALSQFGDLSGIVFNRRSKKLVGGHQRIKCLPKDAEIQISKAWDEITDKGTVSVGTVSVNGELFSYREVDWDEPTERAAMAAANKQGGEWDFPMLIDTVEFLDARNIPMDVVGFDEKEMADLMAPIGGGEDKEKKTKMTQCPNCGETFEPKGNKVG